MNNPHIAPALECLNPEKDFYWENSDLANIRARIEAQAQATLALAYEARTANLLAAYTYGIVGPNNESVDESTIITRLGLGDTK